jgi:hypothetical protein
MIWLTWRQFRVQALTAAAALVAFAIVLAATGPHLATSAYPVVYLVGLALILVAPAITGLFWGAPLIAREFESRTFALVWNPSITRARWLGGRVPA